MVSLFPHMGPLSWGMLGFFLIMGFLMVYKMLSPTKNKMNSIKNLKTDNKKTFVW